jgi:DNA adenine methylase
MTVPQPFQYQGSQRSPAPLILQYLPISTTRLVEPFYGSAALSIATAAQKFADDELNRPKNSA